MQKTFHFLLCSQSKQMYVTFNILALHHRGPDKQHRFTSYTISFIPTKCRSLILIYKDITYKYLPITNLHTYSDLTAA